MIRLTRLRSSDPLFLNPDHIERLDRGHETVVHLLNGHEYVVVESPDEIVEKMTYARARSIALAARLAADTAASDAMSGVGAAAAVQPFPSITDDAVAGLGAER